MNQYSFDKIIELYRLNVETQQNHFNNLLTLIGLIFGVLVTFNWFWNKQLITNEIKELKKNAATLREVIMNDSVKFQSDKEKEITAAFFDQQCKIDQLAVAIFQTSNNVPFAIFYLSRSIDIFRMQNDQIRVRNSIDLLKEYITTEPVSSQKIIFNLEETKKFINKIPDLFYKEKIEILEFLETCTNI